MAHFFPIVRLLTLTAVSVVAFFIDHQAVAAPHTKPVYFDLPEITVALDQEHQAIVQATLRLRGKAVEKRVRDNAIQLRHALVLELSDMDNGGLDAGALDALAERYGEAANLLLRRKNSIKTVLFQKVVVQEK